MSVWWKDKQFEKEVIGQDQPSTENPQSFKDLTDTPNSYIGQAGKLIKVLANESGLEFGDIPSGGGGNSLIEIDVTNPPEGLTPVVMDGTTDNTQAFKDIENYLVANYAGGIMRIPRGVCKANITISNHSIFIKGSGMWGGTFLESFTAGGTALHYNQTKTIFGIEDICIRNSHTGLKLGDTGSKEISRGVMKNIQIIDCTGYALHLVQTINCSYENVYLYRSAYGLFMDLGNVATQQTFINCHFRLNKQNGVRMLNGKGFHFIGCTFETNEKEGVFLTGVDNFIGAQNIVFETCWWEGNATVSSTYTHSTTGLKSGHVALEGKADVTRSGARNIQFKNCLFGNTPGQTSVFSNRSEDCLLENCDFYEKPLFEAVTQEPGNSLTYNLRVINHKKPTLADRNMFPLNNNGSGIIIEYTMPVTLYDTSVNPRILPAKHSNIESLQVYSLQANTPFKGTWNRGDIKYNKNAVAGGYLGEICTQSGTFKSISAVVATTTTTSRNVTVSSNSQLEVGDWIGIASAGTYQIWKVISATEILVDRIPSVAVTNQTVTAITPVFKSFGSIVV